MSAESFIDIDNFIREKGYRYVYCGSISLWLNGMKDEITDFGDIDVDFIDLTHNEKEWVDINYSDELIGDKLDPIPGLPLRYHKIVFDNRELLVSDLDYEIDVKKYFINNIPNYSHKEKALKRIEQIKDFLSKNKLLPQGQSGIG